MFPPKTQPLKILSLPSISDPPPIKPKMAQLPPKAPTFPQNWASFPYQMMQMPSSAAQPPSWVDEFLDFSSSRRNSHRRSASDLIAFIEAPFIQVQCRNGFDRLDDEQLSSMFADDVSANVTRSSSGGPASPSDRNSDNEEKKVAEQIEYRHQQQPKNEPGEVDGGCPTKTDSDKFAFQASEDTSTIVDPKRVKRILANRQSAQRSRVRRVQYISELERSVTTLQTEVSALSPRVAFLDHLRLILNVDNTALKQRIAAFAQDKIFKDAHQEALRKEIERLRKLYEEQQNTNKTEDNAATSPPPPPPPEQPQQQQILQ